MSRREDDEVTAIFAADAERERRLKAKVAAAAEAARQRVIVPADQVDKVKAACEDAHVLLQQIARDYLKLSPTHKTRITQVCIALKHEPFRLEHELRPFPVITDDDTRTARRPAKRKKPAAKRGKAARAKGERAKARPSRRATSP